MEYLDCSPWVMCYVYWRHSVSEQKRNTIPTTTYIFQVHGKKHCVCPYYKLLAKPTFVSAGGNIWSMHLVLEAK